MKLIYSLGNIDIGILVPDKVDVRNWEIFTNEVAPCAAGFVVPLAHAIVQDGHTGLGAESIGLDWTVWLARGPIVEL